VIFLLPPAELKAKGGEIQKAKLSFSELDATRARIQNALVLLSSKPDEARAALKLGTKQLAELQLNLELPNPKLMPALDRYDGVLYQALKQTPLTPTQLANAGKMVFIQSSLFGLISALDLIPSYRLSAGSKLPGINLRQAWMDAHREVWEHFDSQIVIDLRSKAYAGLAPIPETVEWYEVEVLEEDGQGVRKALNHFNKAAKGAFVRSALSANPLPSQLDDLKKIAQLVGMKLELQERKLLLITNPGVIGG
jgi:uncharacterized protein